MASVIFTGIDALRMVLETETDANSPDNETTYGAIRKAIETLFLLLLGTGDSGSATSDPPDNTTGVLTDTGAAYDVDEHNGRTLLITSGTARGNFYTIDDGAATTLSCTDDNLYSDGVKSGDYYAILYDLKVNTDGHDHDGANSKLAEGVGAGAISETEMGAAAVSQTKLKTSIGSVSVTGATTEDCLLPGGTYGFYPQIKATSTSPEFNWSYYPTTSYRTNIAITSVSGHTGYAQQRYVTSSGEVHWVFILKDKATGITIAQWQAPDHPCFGNSGDPELMPHPFPDYDETKHEIICINPSDDDVGKIKAAMITEKGTPNKDFLEVIAEDYDIDEAVNPDYPRTEVTVGLPNGWEELPMGSKITPVKERISQPAMVKTAILKKKIKGQGIGVIE